MVARDWRTRPDPFEAHWAEAEAMLQEAPELEAKALFEWLGEQAWRALSGPEKEVYFP